MNEPKCREKMHKVWVFFPFVCDFADTKRTSNIANRTNSKCVQFDTYLELCGQWIYWLSQLTNCKHFLFLMAMRLYVKFYDLFVLFLWNNLKFKL